MGLSQQPEELPGFDALSPQDRAIIKAQLARPQGISQLLDNQQELDKTAAEAGLRARVSKGAGEPERTCCSAHGRARRRVLDRGRGEISEATEWYLEATKTHAQPSPGPGARTILWQVRVAWVANLQLRAREGGNPPLFPEHRECTAPLCLAAGLKAIRERFAGGC